MIVLSVLYFVVMVLLLFGITIFVHELGHFVVARKLGMKAEVFSIGFGHAIWKKKHDGVIYKIGWIPFGGYVALPQMEPGGGKTTDEAGNEVPLPRVAPWRKILVALAGAVGNIILAVIIAFFIFWMGKPAAPHEVSNRVGYVATNSQAYAVGLRAGDAVVAIRAVDGAEPVGWLGRLVNRILPGSGEPTWEETRNWQDVSMLASLAQEVELRVVTEEGEERVLTVMTEVGALGVKGVRGIPGVDGISYCSVQFPMKGSSAEAAGVLPGDTIVEFNGVRLFSRAQLQDLVNEFPDQEVPMKVERDGEEIELFVTPSFDPDHGRAMIGVRFDDFAVDPTQLVHPPPMQQIRQHASLILRTLRALVTPREARTAASQIGGPPMIFIYLWYMVRAGLVMALWFTCLLNVNLAIINLMPLPVLDGGHIVFSLIEMGLRRPLNEKLVGRITAVFAVLLISAMLFLSVRDVDRFRGSAPAPAPTEEEAPEEAVPENESDQP